MKIILYAPDSVSSVDKLENLVIEPEASSWLERFDSIEADFIYYTRICFVERNDTEHASNKTSLYKVVPVEKTHNPFKYLAIKKDIIKRLRLDLENADAVFVRYQGEYVHFACKEMRRFGVIYSLELGGDPWDAYWNHSFIGKLIAPLMALQCKFDIKWAPYVHYVTKKKLQERYPSKGKTIGLSNVMLKQTDETVLERRKSIINETKKKCIKIGTAANVNVRYKGQQFVIEALADLRKRGYRDFEYHMAGGGDNSRLLALARNLGVEDQVVFEGPIRHSEIFDWLDDLDVYIQPSLQEGLPRAMIEATSRALPCIGSNVAGIPELIDEKWIFDRKKNKPRQIQQLLLDMTSSKEVMVTQAESNYYESLKYQKDLILSERNAFYESILQFGRFN